MPKFVVERQYLVPMFQHIVVEAANLEAACKKAISDDIDWDTQEMDCDSARATTLTAAKAVPDSRDSAYPARGSTHSRRVQGGRVALAATRGNRATRGGASAARELCTRNCPSGMAIDSLVYTVVGDVVTGRLGTEDDVVAHVLLDEAIAIVTADNWVGQVQIADYSAGGL